MGVDDPDVVSEEAHAEGHEETQEEQVEVESKQQVAMGSGLARRREAMVKKKELIDSAAAEEATLKRRADAIALKEKAAMVEASLASVKDNSHHLFEDVGRAYVPSELNTRGGYAQFPTVETKTYAFNSPADDSIFKLLLQITKDTIVRTCQQESKLQNPVELDYECRVLPIVSCVLSKQAPRKEYLAAVRNMQEKLDCVDKSGTVEYMRKEFLGLNVNTKPLKVQVKDLAKKVQAINTHKGIDQYNWEWTLQLGGGFGALKMGEGKGELMPVFTHQAILHNGDEESETVDEESQSLTTAADDNSSIATGDEGMFGKDEEDEKESDDDDDSEDEEEDTRPSSSALDGMPSSSPLKLSDLAIAADDDDANANSENYKKITSGDGEDLAAVTDAAKKKVRIRGADGSENDSDSDDEDIVAAGDVDNEIDKSKTLDINAVLLARWRRSETMAIALTNLRRITWMNMTGWVVQLLQTLQWVHSHYSCIGHFSVNEVLLLPDMAVAVSAKSSVTRKPYTYTQQNTVWMSTAQRARYNRKQRKLIKGLFSRHAWIDSKPWLGHCEVDTSSRRPESVPPTTPGDTTADTHGHSSNSLFSRPRTRTHSGGSNSPPALLPSQIAAQANRGRSSTFDSYDDADDSTALGDISVGDNSPGGLGGRTGVGASGSHAQSDWDPRLTHKTVVFSNLEFLDPKFLGKVLVEKDIGGNEKRTKARENEVHGEMKKFMSCVQRDYKCLGVIIMQMLLRRPLDDFENKRVFSSHFGIDNVPELIDVSSYGKAGEQARDLCALMECCFRSSNGIDIEPARKRGFLAGKYYSLQLPKICAEFMKHMQEVVEIEKEGHEWVKKTGFKHRDKLRLRRQREAKENYYAHHKVTGPETAAARILEDKKKLWFDLLNPEQQAKIRQKQRLRELSEEHRLERVRALHQATFHHWGESEFRHWCHEAILQYLRKAWAIRRPTLSNRSIRLSEIEKETVGEALGPVEFQKYGLVKRLLQHHGAVSGIANAELRNIKPTNFELDSDLEKMFFLMGKDFSNVLSEESSAMECALFFEESMELSKTKLEKNGFGALLSGPQFQHKQIQFECDFFIKIFADYHGLWDTYLDSLGYGEEVMDKKELKGASPEMIEEMIKYNKKREALVMRICRCVTYAMLEKYHANHWQRTIGVDIAASKMIAGYRRMKVMKIMNRVWRKVLDEHGDYIAEEEEAKKNFLLENPLSEVKTLMKPIERVKEILAPPTLHAVSPSIAVPDIRGNGKVRAIEGSLDVKISLQLRQTHFGEFTPGRMKDLTCLAAVVMQPPHLPSVDSVPFNDSSATATDKLSLRELAAKRKRQQMLYEGEVVVIMHDNRDLYKWLTLQMVDRVFDACRESAANRREALLQEVSDAHLLPPEDMLALPMPHLDQYKMCPTSILGVTVPPPLPQKRGRDESTELTTTSDEPADAQLNKHLAATNAKIAADNKLSVELAKLDPNQITLRIGGLQGFSRYRVRVMCSQLITPLQPLRRNPTAWMTRYVNMPVPCCLHDANTTELDAAYDAREEELKEKGKRRADDGAGPGDDLENIVDIAKNTFLEMNWTLPGQTSPAKPQAPKSLLAQTISSQIDTSIAEGKAPINREEKLRLAAEDDSEEEEMDWGTAATLRERVERLPKVKECANLHHLVALSFQPSMFTGGDALQSFRLSRSISVEVQTNSTAGLFPMSAATEYDEEEGKAGEIAKTKKPRIWERRGKWSTINVINAQDSAFNGSYDSREAQDRVSAEELLTFLKTAVDLPEGLLDPKNGNIDHWRYNPLPSLEGFERKVALEHAHFVINVQYRISSTNKHGTSRWTYTVDCPICTIVPDKKGVLKNPVMALSKPYVDSASFAQKNLLRFSQFTIENMRDYSELIIKPIEVTAGGGLGLLLGKEGDDSRPGTRGTTAPDTRGTTAASLHTNFGQDLDGNSTIATQGMGGDESLASLDKEDDPFLERGVGGGVLFEQPTEEDEDMAWLMKLTTAKPVVAEIKPGPR